MAMIDFSNATMTPLYANYTFDYMGLRITSGYQLVLCARNDSAGQNALSVVSANIIEDNKNEFSCQLTGSFQQNAPDRGFVIWLRYGSATKYALFDIQNTSDIYAGDTYSFSIKAQFDLS